MEGYVEKNISEELGGVSPYAVIQCKTGQEWTTGPAVT